MNPASLIALFFASAVSIRHTAGVAELHLRCEHLGASFDSLGDDGFANDTLLDGLDDAVLLDTPDFNKQDEHLAVEHLAVEIFLVTEMVDGSRAR